MKKFILIAMMALTAAQTVWAERIKDIASVNGVRSNQLIGYGLVVGLNGTGDNTPFAEQSLKSMLRKFGIQVPNNVKTNSKNVAAVAVHAELPPFSKPGQKIDVTVSSLGNAKELRGGTLLVTQLKALNGETYAIAQGNLIVGGLDASGADGSRITVNVPSVGRVPNGATVEREVPSSFNQGNHVTLNLHQQDFTTAMRMAEQINSTLGEGTAQAVDASSVQVLAPRIANQRVSFISVLENLQVEPGQTAARVIVNSRTGTVVISQNVIVTPAAVSHGNMVVRIEEDPNVVQPNPLANGQAAMEPDTNVNVQAADSRMFNFHGGTSLNDIVDAVNKVGAAPGDIVAILEALKQAGSLKAELIVI